MVKKARHYLELCQGFVLNEDTKYVSVTDI